MSHWKLKTGIMACLWAVPYLVLGVLGMLWLRERGWLITFFAGAAVLNAVAWGITSFWRRSARKPARGPVTIEAGQDDWPPAGHTAWQKICVLANDVARNRPPIERPEQVGPLLYEILNLVAREFHPTSEQPAWEVTIPDALQISELVVRDLRVAFQERVPGAAMLTLRDAQQLRNLAGLWQKIYAGYRWIQLGINPMAGLFRGLRDAAADKVIDESFDEVQRWTTDFVIQQAGRYAIDLYSGKLVVHNPRFSEFQTEQSKAEKNEASQRQSHLDSEPLRILVTGQVKAGKSSLINALCRGLRAGTDVLPLTDKFQPHHLKTGEGSSGAIILDTPGYQAAGDSVPHGLITEETLQNIDLFILVCSATSAARAPDRHLLDLLREHFRQRPGRIPPPIVIVLTHIDQVRPFAEWAPPYDLNDETRAKSRSIRDAIEVVAEEFDMDPALIAPVCLQADRIYNVDETLWPMLTQAMSAAGNAKLLRCLKEFHQQEQWTQLQQQSLSAGRWIVRQGTNWATQKFKDLLNSAPSMKDGKTK